MKPETIIKIGHVEMTESVAGNILVTPRSSLYHTDFTPVYHEFMEANGCLFRNTHFLVKDNDSVFHKFFDMKYEGVVEPPPSAEEMLKRLIERFHGALVVSSGGDAIVISNDRVIANGCSYIDAVLRNYASVIDDNGQNKLRYWKIGSYNKKGSPALNTEGTKFIQKLYKEYFPS